MKKYRTSLPPLDLLIFFEAAHRRGTFTACAEELHVSQAAVSKRIRQLEAAAFAKMRLSLEGQSQELRHFLT